MATRAARAARTTRAARAARTTRATRASIGATGQPSAPLSTAQRARTRTRTRRTQTVSTRPSGRIRLPAPVHYGHRREGATMAHTTGSTPGIPATMLASAFAGIPANLSSTPFTSDSANTLAGPRKCPAPRFPCRTPSTRRTAQRTRWITPQSRCAPPPARWTPQQRQFKTCDGAPPTWNAGQEHRHGRAATSAGTGTADHDSTSTGKVAAVITVGTCASAPIIITFIGAASRIAAGPAAALVISSGMVISMIFIFRFWLWDFLSVRRLSFNFLSHTLQVFTDTIKPTFILEPSATRQQARLFNSVQRIFPGNGATMCGEVSEGD